MSSSLAIAFSDPITRDDSLERAASCAASTPHPSTNPAGRSGKIRFRYGKRDAFYVEVTE